MHASRCVIAVLPVALSISGLGGCDKLSSTTIVRTLEDGTRNDKSWSRTWKDRAKFKCLASTSGSCEIVVFTSDCADASCTARVVKELSLPVGKSMQVSGLPRGFKHCIAHDAKPVVPACLKA